MVTGRAVGPVSGQNPWLLCADIDSSPFHCADKCSTTPGRSGLLTKRRSVFSLAVRLETLVGWCAAYRLCAICACARNLPRFSPRTLGRKISCIVFVHRSRENRFFALFCQPVPAPSEPSCPGWDGEHHLLRFLLNI